MGTPHVGRDMYSQTDLTIFFVGAVWARRARRTSSIVGDAGAFPLEDELGGGLLAMLLQTSWGQVWREAHPQYLRSDGVSR